MNTRNSDKAFAEAKKYIPGGVNSPVRAFGHVGGTPRFIQKASGVILTDIDGNEYIDFNLSWGVFLQGHANEYVLDAARQALSLGTSFGTPTENETAFSRFVSENVPGVERLRLVNSGTEAVMSVLRLAKAHTQRKLVVKFEGCYHGHSDNLLQAAGSGLATIDSKKFAHADVITLPFDNLGALTKVFESFGNEIAAVIIEPFPANMGLIETPLDFMCGVKKLCEHYGSLLIFDEVITGFRFNVAGADSYFNVSPDLRTFGKIIGGGFPIGAFGGKAEIMDKLAPLGDVYQAGTLSGNPVATAAGLATFELLSQPGFYNQLDQIFQPFVYELNNIARQYGASVNAFGNMFTLFYAPEKVSCFKDVQESDLEKFNAFYHALLAQGVYFSPSPYETNFISSKHTQKQLTEVLEKVEKAFRKI